MLQKIFNKKITSTSDVKQNINFSLQGFKAQPTGGKKVSALIAALNQAQHLRQKGDFKNSIALYKKILHQKPNCTQAALAISVLYNDLGQYNKAQVYFKQATREKTKPNLTALKSEVIKKYQELAAIYTKHKQPQVSIKYQLTALALNPTDKNIYISLGENLIRLGQYSKAISIFKYLHSQDPRSYKIQFQLAHTYYKNKQTLQASIIWNNLSKKFPNKQEARVLGQLAQALKVI